MKFAGRERPLCAEAALLLALAVFPLLPHTSQAAELRPARLEEGEALPGANTTVAAGCIELPGLAPLGQMLLAAAANLQPDFEACWLSCLAMAGCNALAFCDPAFQDGCASSNQTDWLPPGGCELRQQALSAPETGRPLMVVEAPDLEGGAPIQAAAPPIDGFEALLGASFDSSSYAYPCNGSLAAGACMLRGSAQELAPLCLADPACQAMASYPFGVDFSGPDVTAFLTATGAELNVWDAVYNPNAALYLKQDPSPLADSSVCSVDSTTYPSAATAAAARATVLHCGACGACSNMHDAEVYLRTASNLTLSVRSCGLGLGAKRGACLEHIGFTPRCAACYSANIDCDAQRCLAPCLAQVSAEAGRPAGQLQDLATNPCLACDEAQCGPAFKACAGANRRRLGIVSDIARDEAELCRDGLFYVNGAGAAGAAA